jgi:hypothetical protein
MNRRNFVAAAVGVAVIIPLSGSEWIGAMTHYVALLRGVNVAGRMLAMSPSLASGKGWD